MLAPSPQIPLPLLIVDISSARSERSSARAVDPTGEPVSRRTAPVVGSATANVVRLIPGVTRLPIGFVQR
jgi:hypothetical protein